MTTSKEVKIKAGMMVKHTVINEVLKVVADENGPAYTGNEFKDDEIALSYAIHEYNEGRLIPLDKEVLHTQGTLFADYGDYDRLKDADEIFLRIESEGETYDLARFGCNETENPKQWAELICKAVNERQQTESNMAAYKNMQIELLKAHTERQRLIDEIEGLKKINNDLRQSLAASVKIHMPFNKNLNK